VESASGIALSSCLYPTNRSFAFNLRLTRFVLLFVVGSILPATLAAQQVYEPQADPRAVIINGHARFTILTPQMIRMEWDAGSNFEDRPSFIVLNRHLPVPAFKQAIEGGDLVIRTSALELHYKTASGKFTADNLSIHFTVEGEQKQWTPGASAANNLMGTTRTLDGVRGDAVKLETGLVSRDGWALIDDSKSALFDSADFSFRQGEQSVWPWVVERTQSDRQDWYFLGYGHAYREALQDYTKIAGKIPLPPRFAFGAWWSRYWDYSDAELRDLVQQFHEHKVPLDVLVIDMGWHLSPDEIPLKEKLDYSGHSIGWSGYTWSPKYFPHPEEFLTWVHQQGLKATLNLHPASGVQPWEAPFPAMAAAMGIDPAKQKYVPFDITNKQFAVNYMNILHHPLEKQGIDFWWLDWQQEMKTKLADVNPTWWLNYVHFTDQEREGKRPLIFHRWGGLGNHRYEIGFSGDTVSVWESLAFQPYFTATAANVGYSYWSHDIGGHMPGAVDPELYTRWIQFGIFSPILRTHTTKNPNAERRIWAYPDTYYSAMRSAFLLRYRIQPYIYTEARRTYDTGVAFVHPLYYDDPEVDEAYAHHEEYKFGDNILVSPIVEPADQSTHISSKDIWLPPGEWIEWQTGAHLTGPGSFHRNFTIAQTPVYVKAGSIIPMQPDMSYTGERPVDPMIFEVLPFAAGQRDSNYNVYEDSGKDEDYIRGQSTRTAIRVQRTRENEYQVTIAPVQGSYPGMMQKRSYEIRMDSPRDASAITFNKRVLRESKVNGANPGGSGWRYDEESKQVVIGVASESVHSDCKLTIVLKTEKQAAR
jgi:alpha-glucosidase (family GH31 glycosyl hydrolase)